jgi:hypothetical protein
MQKHIKARKVRAPEIHTKSTNVSSLWLLITFGFLPVFRASYNHEFCFSAILCGYLEWRKEIRILIAGLPARQPRACIRPLAWPKPANIHYAVQQSPHRSSRLFQGRFEAGSKERLFLILGKSIIAFPGDLHLV